MATPWDRMNEAAAERLARLKAPQEWAQHVARSTAPDAPACWLWTDTPSMPIDCAWDAWDASMARGEPSPLVGVTWDEFWMLQRRVYGCLPHHDKDMEIHSIFGPDEDERMLNGRARVYGLTQPRE